MTAPKLWHVIYWAKGASPATARILTDDPLPYAEARRRAKRARFLPVLFGCMADIRRA